MKKVLMSGAMSAALLVGCAHAGDYGRPGYSGYSGGSQGYSSQPYSGGYQPPYERGYEDRGYQDRGYQESRYQNSGYQGGNQCWQEPVRVIEKPGFFRSNIGLLAGGVAGGLIGGQIGHGTGRK